MLKGIEKDVPSTLSNTTAMDAWKVIRNEIQKVAKFFHPAAWHLLDPNSKYHCWKRKPMLEGPKI